MPIAAFTADPAVRRLRAEGFLPAVRSRIAALLAEGAATRSFGDPGYDDAALYEVVGAAAPFDCFLQRNARRFGGHQYADPCLAINARIKCAKRADGAETRLSSLIALLHADALGCVVWPPRRCAAGRSA